MAEDDAERLEAVARGEFAINCFRNADLRQTLFGADGLIHGAPRTRRWMLSGCLADAP